MNDRAEFRHAIELLHENLQSRFLELCRLPASVLGPVDDSHGCHRLIASAMGLQ
jgi:hypothetical protein